MSDELREAAETIVWAFGKRSAAELTSFGYAALLLAEDYLAQHPVASQEPSDKLREAVEQALHLVQSAAPHVAARKTTKLLKLLAEAWLAEHPVASKKPMGSVPFLSLETDREYDR